MKILVKSFRHQKTYTRDSYCLVFLSWCLVCKLDGQYEIKVVPHTMSYFISLFESWKIIFSKWSSANKSSADLSDIHLSSSEWACRYTRSLFVRGGFCLNNKYLLLGISPLLFISGCKWQLNKRSRLVCANL